MEHKENCKANGFMKWYLSWRGAALTIALAAISYYLLTVHLAHFALALPYLFLLACPLMHIFGHGHGHHNHEHDDKK